MELEEGEMGGIKIGNREEWNGGDGRGQHVVLNLKYTVEAFQGSQE